MNIKVDNSKSVDIKKPEQGFKTIDKRSKALRVSIIIFDTKCFDDYSNEHPYSSNSLTLLLPCLGI